MWSLGVHFRISTGQRFGKRSRMSRMIFWHPLSISGWKKSTPPLVDGEISLEIPLSCRPRRSMRRVPLWRRQVVSPTQKGNQTMIPNTRITKELYVRPPKNAMLLDEHLSVLRPGQFVQTCNTTAAFRLKSSFQITAVRTALDPPVNSKVLLCLHLDLTR